MIQSRNLWNLKTISIYIIYQISARLDLVNAVPQAAQNKLPRAAVGIHILVYRSEFLFRLIDFVYLRHKISFIYLLLHE